MGRRSAVIVLTACGAVLAVAVGITLAGGSSAGDGYRFHRLRFGRDAYRYVVYVPPGRLSGPGMPLVVVLHGCTMTASQEAAATGYDQIAASNGFVVLYADVDAVDRANGRCWKGIWDPGAEGRGRGDAGAIAAMTRAVIARWRIDASRVYAIGISAGGFETAMLGAAYPDLYTAIGIHSGAGYLAGEQGCPANGSDGNGDGSALAAMGSRARVMPVIVFHGDRDGRVPYEQEHDERDPTDGQSAEAPSAAGAGHCRDSRAVSGGEVERPAIAISRSVVTQNRPRRTTRCTCPSTGTRDACLGCPMSMVAGASARADIGSTSRLRKRVSSSR
jgi:poly(hydroxyalkanoate) depolymerase family esterase